MRTREGKKKKWRGAKNEEIKCVECKYVFSDFVCLGANDSRLNLLCESIDAYVRVRWLGKMCSACVCECVCVDFECSHFLQSLIPIDKHDNQSITNRM